MSKENIKEDVKSILSEIYSLTDILKESYVFDERDEIYGADEPMEGEPTLEDEMCKDDDKVTQIRQMALNGIQEYAHDVDSEYYQFYKKVWMMCDKVCSEKESTKETE